MALSNAEAPKELEKAIGRHDMGGAREGRTQVTSEGGVQVTG